jgi:hypothetical protein
MPESTIAMPTPRPPSPDVTPSVARSRCPSRFASVVARPSVLDGSTTCDVRTVASMESPSVSPCSDSSLTTCAGNSTESVFSPRASPRIVCCLVFSQAATRARAPDL